jgi:hypothetical protein
LEIVSISLGAGTTASGGFLRPKAPQPEPEHSEPEHEIAHDHH